MSWEKIDLWKEDSLSDSLSAHSAEYSVNWDQPEQEVCLALP